MPPKVYGGATKQERGEAAQAREKYVLSPQDRQLCNKVVHDKSDKPVNFSEADLNPQGVKKTWKGN